MGDPINLFLEEALARQRDEMMNIFSQILRRMPTTTDASTSSSHFGGMAPFKVEVNFYIPIFKGQIDADALEKWVNILEGYFSVYNFSDRENITFSLLKVVPNVKDWETYCEKKSTRESEMFGTKPTWHILWMRLRGNFSLLETMRTNTRDGPHCDRKGTEQC